MLYSSMEKEGNLLSDPRRKRPMSIRHEPISLLRFELIRVKKILQVERRRHPEMTGGETTLSIGPKPISHLRFESQ